MQKIRIRLPATISGFAPGLALALRLYTTVEMSLRSDSRWDVNLNGAAALNGDSPLQHPVVLGLGRFFQHIEKSLLGLNLAVENDIPLGAGLGAESSLAVAGVIAANQLMNTDYGRDALLAIIARDYPPAAVSAAVLGGLAAAFLEDNVLVHRALPCAGFEFVVVVPQIDRYAPPALPEQMPRRETSRMVTHIPLLLESLRSGDIDLLAQSLDSGWTGTQVDAHITGFGHVTEIARRSGAIKVLALRDGPMVIALARRNHARLAENMVEAFAASGIEARSWVLPLDTQGIVFSAMQSAV